MGRSGADTYPRNSNYSQNMHTRGNKMPKIAIFVDFRPESCFGPPNARNLGGDGAPRARVGPRACQDLDGKVGHGGIGARRLWPHRAARKPQIVLENMTFVPELHREKWSHAVRRWHTRRRPAPPYDTVLVRSWGALGPTHARGTLTMVKFCMLGAIKCPKSRFLWVSAQNRVLGPPVRAIWVATEPHGNASGRGHART